jgi:hypothetical protein
MSFLIHSTIKRGVEEHAGVAYSGYGNGTSPFTLAAPMCTLPETIHALATMIYLP